MVFTRLEDYSLRLKKSKCEFLKTRVEYLGYCIDADGLQISSKSESNCGSPKTSEPTPITILLRSCKLLWQVYILTVHHYSSTKSTLMSSDKMALVTGM